MQKVEGVRQNRGSELVGTGGRGKQVGGGGGNDGSGETRFQDGQRG